MAQRIGFDSRRTALVTHKEHPVKPPDHICTKENPWRRDMEGRTEHPEATYKWDKDWGDGEITAEYHCPICGLNFSVELPQ